MKSKLVRVSIDFDEEVRKIMKKKDDSYVRVTKDISKMIRRKFNIEF